MQKLFIIFAGLFGLLGNALGAFGAHALKAKFTPAMLAVYQTGVQYQFYHALSLLLVAVLLFHIHSSWLHLSGLAFIAGIVDYYRKKGRHKLRLPRHFLILSLKFTV